MSRFLPLFLDCRKGPSRFLSDYCLLFIEFGADASRPCADVRQGIIAAANRDGRKIVNKGEPANFLVYCPVDDDTSKHNLTLDGYAADGRWVLLVWLVGAHPPHERRVHSWCV